MGINRQHGVSTAVLRRLAPRKVGFELKPRRMAVVSVFQPNVETLG